MRTPEEVQAMVILALFAGHLFLIGLSTYLSKRWWGKRGLKTYLVYAGVNFVPYISLGIGLNPLLLLILVKVFHFRKSQLEGAKNER